MKLYDARTNVVRRTAEAQQARRLDHPLPADTRRWLLDGRNGLLYLPSHGTHGGIISEVAASTGVSRQRVQKVLFPDNVEELFGIGVTGRQIWATTADKVYGHPLFDNLKKAFETLEKTGSLVIQAPVGIITFFLKRAGNLGLKANVIESEATSPMTYDIRLASKTIGSA